MNKVSRSTRPTAALLLVGLLAMPMIGCEFGIVINESVPEYTIPGSGGIGGSIPVSSFTLDVTQDPDFQNRSLDSISEVEIRGLELRILPKSDQSASDPIEDGQADNWNFVTSAQVRMAATVNGSPREVTIAFVNAGDPQLSSGVRVLTFETTGENIKDLILAEGGYTVSIQYAGTAPVDDVIFDGDVQYRLVIEF